MTDRYCSFIVVLDEDIRDDDAEPIKTSLMMTKHVIDVIPVVTDMENAIAESRALSKLRMQLHKVLYPKMGE